MHRRAFFLVALAVLSTALVAFELWFYWRPERTLHREIAMKPKPEAPPDLADLRSEFASGLDALHRKDGPDAVQHLASFTFRKRAVEQYRLFYLASAHQLAGEKSSARATLADLWTRDPTMVPWPDAAMNLAGLDSESGDFARAAAVYDHAAARAETSDVAAPARWGAIETHFYSGDIDAVFDQARSIAIRNPASAQAAAAMNIVRSLNGAAPGAPIALTPAERLGRCVSLLRDGDPYSAFAELTVLEESSALPEDLRQPAELNRGLALLGVQRVQDAAKVLDTLIKAEPRIAIPALYFSAKSDRILSASINPIVYKTVVVRQQVGVRKVKRGGKLVLKPKYAKVKKQVPLVDLAKKAQKDGFDHLASQRLKQLLPLPLAIEVRISVLNTLIEMAESKNQDDYERQLVEEVVRVDPGNEDGLQHFWDKAWAAYERGDLNGARELFAFVETTYRSPNVKRMAKYWYARAGDRLGKHEEASAIYRNLAAAPYEDLYSLEAGTRLGQHDPARTAPRTTGRPDWRDIAEKSMPPALRLASELTALSDVADARREIAKNQAFGNQHFADALTADLDNSSGNMEGMMIAARRAFPDLATVEQDSVPPYFLKMYYPVHYEDAIRLYAKKNDLDPYLVFGLIHQESYFNPAARSRAGAVGLMQLMPSTGHELAHVLHTSSSLTDPVNNIRLGTFHFRQLVNLFTGNTALAIASYNAGQGRVAQWRRAAPGRPLDEFIEDIPFRETRTYVKHVVMLQSSYRRLLE